MVNYLYDCYTILNKVYSDKTYIKQAISSTNIEEKNRALTIKTVYGVLDTDIELSYYIKKLCDKNPKLVIRTILKISMYAIKYLEKHDYAVIKNAVELTKKLGKGGMSGFVNAFLRKFVSTKIELPKNKNEFLSIKYSYPLFAVNDLIKTYGYDRTESIISTKNSKTCLTFFDIDGGEYLSNKNLIFQKTQFQNVFMLDNFVRDDGFEKGLYTYQALGSVAICDIVEPCDELLDCCSAPGGKSVRLSYKCKKVTSWDIHQHRVELVNEYANRMKRKNITTAVFDAKTYNKNLEQKFDAVLCDVPCSGLGVVNDNPDIKLNREENNIIELNKEQLSILKTVSNYVKLGGYLYYSTCSIIDRENNEIIRQFMSSKNNYIVKKIDSKLNHIVKDYGIQFLPDISNGLGFYICKLKRIK